ncbi:MAG: hypothetical protein HRU40_01720 [Saprospiraceae bacterium]|nr:hypothetical protein [Saprospiraceae bacterium]
MNRFVRSIRELDRREMSRFVAFVHSAYLNKHKGVRILVDYLNSVYPNVTLENAHVTHLEKVVMSHPDIKTGSFAPVLTYAQRLLESFFAMESFLHDDFQQQLYLLQQLRHRKQTEPYERHLKKAQKILDKNRKQDARHLFHRFQLGYETGEYFVLQEKRQADTSLQERQNAFDLYFISEKLRDACEIQVRQEIMKGEYELRFLGPILEDIRCHLEKYQSIPAIFIFYSLYQMLREEDHQYYFAALHTIQENKMAFDRPDLITIYNYLMNFCIARINRNDKGFLQELFTLYKLQLSDDLLLDDGYLSEWDYKNIVTTALRLNELPWAIQFIEEYKALLLPGSRENAYRFNKASYHYEAREYDSVLELLTQVEYSDLRYSLGTRALLMRTYYDLDEFDALHALTESFKQYLLRNRLMSDTRRLGYYNLFRLTRKTALLRTRFPYLKKEKANRELDKIMEEIGSTDEVFNRSWLVKKINDLRD